MLKTRKKQFLKPALALVAIAVIAGVGNSFGTVFAPIMNTSTNENALNSNLVTTNNLPQTIDRAEKTLPSSDHPNIPSAQIVFKVPPLIENDPFEATPIKLKIETPKYIQGYDPIITTSKISVLEYKIHDLINIQRQNYGLYPLAFNSSLQQIAETHSKDMAKRNYYDHITPEGITHTQRGVDAGFVTCGGSGEIMQQDLDQKGIAIDAMKQDLAQKSAILDGLKNQYEPQVEQYNKESSHYQSSVINDQTTYDNLQSEYNSLNVLKNNIDSNLAEYNTEAQKLNSLVDDYNTESTSRNENAGTVYGIAENINKEWKYMKGDPSQTPMYHNWMNDDPDTLARNTVDAWMNSQDHRENILTPFWQKEGIGVGMSPTTIYVTEDFC